MISNFFLSIVLEKFRPRAEEVPEVKLHKLV